ncbi:MAG: DUF4876 domain-containing protein [Muribaculaceae bacterium]|nr:DUF4876 domain-containing protein [Muribaculaceae bacterium]
MKNYMLILAVAAASALTACSDNDDTIEYLPAGVTIELPSDAQGYNLTDEKLTFTNVSTGAVSTFGSTGDVNVIPGIYDITYEAKAVTPEGATLTFRGRVASVNITAAGQSISIPVIALADTDDLIISEVFYTKTLNTSGKTYNADGYIKLYNNTDHVIYADGLTLFESAFATTQKFEYTPNIMNEAMTVWALYTVPGNGTEYPVQPGEYFLIADNGIDHRTANPNSFDLSHADVEWYDESSVPSVQDIDSPVPNMDKWYCYTASIWLMNAQSNRAWGIARIPMTKEQYLDGGEYWYTYEWDQVLASGTYHRSGQNYKILNSWIVDVVNSSSESDFKWIVTSPALDMGWAWVGSSSTDKSVYFKSIRRKLLSVDANGKPIFKDTNNSSADFNCAVTPSEIELQGTAIDAEGTKFSGRPTYDGVVTIDE